MVQMKRGKPLLERIFGENNTIKVLDFFLMGKDFDFTIAHIRNGTGLSRTAINNAIQKLLDVEIIEKSRADGKSDYYKINRKSNKYMLIEGLYQKIMVEIA